MTIGLIGERLVDKHNHRVKRAASSVRSPVGGVQRCFRSGQEGVVLPAPILIARTIEGAARRVSGQCRPLLRAPAVFAR